MSSPKGKCIRCGGVLVPMGKARDNGKSHNDWASRTMHKKCWKKQQEIERQQRIAMKRQQIEIPEIHCDSCQDTGVFMFEGGKCEIPCPCCSDEYK